MVIVLNGARTDLPEDADVADAVRLLGHDPSRPGVAAAVDGTVVRRTAWTATALHEGAVVEVLTAVQGGA